MIRLRSSLRVCSAKKSAWVFLNMSAQSIKEGHFAGGPLPRLFRLTVSKLFLITNDTLQYLLPIVLFLHHGTLDQGTIFLICAE